MDVVTITGPTKEPLTIDEVRMHLRNPERTDNDAELMEFIATAREDAEQRLGRALMTQTLEASLDHFPVCYQWPYSRDQMDIELPYPPLQSVTSITYVDENGATQTLATDVYVVDTRGKFGKVRLAPNKSWPTVSASVRGAITIRYVAGWASSDAIPALIKQWMRLQITRMNQHRSPDVIGASLETLGSTDHLLDRWCVHLPV